MRIRRMGIREDTMDRMVSSVIEWSYVLLL